ncbi:MAG: hypothetical protein HYW28_14835 [Rhodospirillales bacterium]|nr:hypothetical protein [Rhodospirillales bacterium]
MPILGRRRGGRNRRRAGALGRTHWGQAVQFFEREIAVDKGQQLAVTVTWSDHQISFAAGKR